MKIAMIHGQNHVGSTCRIGRLLAEKIGGEVTEFFLPRDFGEFCVGCATCFMKDETKCPHHEKLLPFIKAMDEADVIILTSPVYVYHATGSMKTFLDHFGYRWMVHRPRACMFTKQAVCISTAAGAGMKSTNKDMADSLFFWGIPRIYKLGMAVAAIRFDQITEKKRATIEKKTTVLASKIRRNHGRVKPGVKTKAFFSIMRFLHKKEINPADRVYWEAQGWLGRKRPWK
ncbi:NADPH-dependent FMN reductase [Lachnospiraceae bacterium XBB1006]|nr:NADPH-dependent FMN reductase [Lachnospiraceae bacterium XBB1006]